MSFVIIQMIITDKQGTDRQILYFNIQRNIWKNSFHQEFGKIIEVVREDRSHKNDTKIFFSNSNILFLMTPEYNQCNEYVTMMEVYGNSYYN